MRIVVTQMLELPNEPFAATTLINPWARNAIQRMRTLGHEVIHLVGPQDTQENLDKVLRDSDPQLYVNYGHGWEDTIIGQDLTTRGLELVENDTVLATFGPLIDKRNSQWLNARINFVVSCLTAEELGPDAISKGAAAYLGYRDTFEFGIQGQRTAPGFEESANVGLFALLEGQTIGEARDITINTLNLWMQQYYNMGGSIPTSFAALLRHDRNSLRVLGDLNARLL